MSEAFETGRSVSAAHLPRLPKALGERIDIVPVVDALRPLIAASEAQMDEERRLPQPLVDALREAGIFHTLYPRELGGLELHVEDFMDLTFELSRIDGSVGWIAVIQNGLSALLAPAAMSELMRSSGGPLIVSGSHGRIGDAVRVDGGYRFTGRWAFASGAPWATHLTAYARVSDGDGNPIVDPANGGPVYIDGLFPKASADYVGGWHSMGLRGTASGQFSLEDAFIEERFTTAGPPHEAYTDRAVFRAPLPGALAAVMLGIAQGAVDAFVELSKRPARGDSWGNRADELGSHPLHQIDLAHADGLIRAARSWVWTTTQRALDVAFEDDESLRYEVLVESLQATTYGARIAKQAINLIFDVAGTDAVIIGQGIERRFRDLHTAAQHSYTLETSYRPIGQYYLSRGLRDGPEIDTEGSMLPPP
ncbi:MAG TPA: acyl-CoA dehydrogenase family protein [Baekduia sp.]|nr:acyl-CoA dehydrogenase family protein [Baekduia sp.]